MKLLIALALCALLGCAAGQDGGALEQRFIGKPVQKTGLVTVSTRAVSLAAYTGNILFATEYEFKCVAAGAGCDATAQGTTVSGVFNKGRSTVVGTITGLEPETVYDCYVITNDKKCGKPFRVETEPSLLLGGSLWSCDIEDTINQVVGSERGLGALDCLEISSGEIPDNFVPLSIVVGGEKVTFTYFDSTDFNVYGVQTCTLTQAGTKVTDCMEVLDQEDQELDPSLPYGLEILGKQAYVTRPGEQDVLLCTIDKDGEFTDCAATGPKEKAFLSLYASGDKMYLSGDGVTVCSIEANGKLSSCKVAYEKVIGMENELEPVQIQGVEINAKGMEFIYGTAIQGSNAYITSPSANAVYLCSVKSDGTFTGCEPTGLQGDFQSPAIIVIQGSMAYIGSDGSSFVTVCSILESGELAGCENKNTPVSNVITAIAV